MTTLWYGPAVIVRTASEGKEYEECKRRGYRLLGEKFDSESEVDGIFRLMMEAIDVWGESVKEELKWLNRAILLAGFFQIADFSEVRDPMDAEGFRAVLLKARASLIDSGIVMLVFVVKRCWWI